MLGILILVGVFAGFYNAAKNNNQNPILWGILSIVTWFASQFILGLIWGIVDPNVLAGGAMKVMVGGFIASVIGVTILYFILMNYAKKKKAKSHSDEIMDDNSFDDL